MYTIKVKSQFNSAHNLRGYKGKCEALHGHNWHVEAAIGAEDLDDVGMVMDFKELKASLVNILSDLDHKYINELEFFKTINPTSENIAHYIYNKLSRDLERPGLEVKDITVWETDTSAATFSRKRI